MDCFVNFLEVAQNRVNVELHDVSFTYMKGAQEKISDFQYLDRLLRINHDQLLGVIRNQLTIDQ